MTVRRRPENYEKRRRNSIEGAGGASPFISRTPREEDGRGLASPVPNLGYFHRSFKNNTECPKCQPKIIPKNIDKIRFLLYDICNHSKNEFLQVLRLDE